MKAKVNELLKVVKSNNSNKIISIDESSFDIRIRKIKGWSKKGHKIIRKNKNMSNRQRITLTLGINKNKIVGYQIIKGSANKKTYEKFLNNDIMKNVKNSILLMDNARIHHFKNIISAVKNTTNKIVYNVPYNPETNPVEHIFSIIKNNVRNKNICNIEEIKKEIIKTLKNIKKKTLANIFKHSLDI